MLRDARDDAREREKAVVGCLTMRGDGSRGVDSAALERLADLEVGLGRREEADAADVRGTACDAVWVVGLWRARAGVREGRRRERVRTTHRGRARAGRPLVRSCRRS